jgi:hypothetical protein
MVNGTSAVYAKDNPHYMGAAKMARRRSGVIGIKPPTDGRRAICGPRSEDGSRAEKPAKAGGVGG